MRFEEFIDNLSQLSGWQITKQEELETYLVVVTTEEGRRQNVIMDKIREGEYEIIRFRSAICDSSLLKGNRPIYALKLNSGLAFGSFAVDADKLVLNYTACLKNIMPEHVVSVLIYLAKQSDRYEKLLTEEDKH